MTGSDHAREHWREVAERTGPGLIRLVQEAMASGAVSYVERVRDGEITGREPGSLLDLFEEQATTFLGIRQDLVDDAVEGIVTPPTTEESNE